MRKRIPKILITGGESIKVFPQEMPEQFAFSPEDIPLDVVHEDESIIVVNKPPGLVVHPAAHSLPSRPPIPSAIFLWTKSP